MKTIEELLQDEAIRFLDTHLSKKQDRHPVARFEEQSLFDLKKDYEKEVEDALEKDDLRRAKKLFDELRQNYAKLKYSDVGKAKFFRILDNIHLKIKKYLIDKQKERDIYEDINTYEAQQAGKPATGAQASTVDQQLQQRTMQIEHLLNQGEVEQAKKEAKQLVAAYNQLDDHDRTVGRYETIKHILLKIPTP